MIRAQHAWDEQCIYMSTLLDTRKGYLEKAVMLAKKYVHMYKELEYQFESFEGREKTQVYTSDGNEKCRHNCDIASHQQAEQWAVTQELFNHRSKMCSHVFSDAEFDFFASEIGAKKVSQITFDAKFEVGTNWGMELDYKTGEVIKVEPDSPADKQQVKAGDFVISVDSIEPFNLRRYQNLLHVQWEGRNDFPHFKFHGVINFRRTVGMSAAFKDPKNENGAAAPRGFLDGAAASLQVDEDNDDEWQRHMMLVQSENRYSAELQPLLGANPLYGLNATTTSTHDL